MRHLNETSVSITLSSITSANSFGFGSLSISSGGKRSKPKRQLTGLALGVNAFSLFCNGFVLQELNIADMPTKEAERCHDSAFNAGRGFI